MYSKYETASPMQAFSDRIGPDRVDLPGRTNGTSSVTKELGVRGRLSEHYHGKC